MNFKEKVKALSFENVPTENITMEVNDRINQIIIQYPEFEYAIIEELPENIKIIYRIGELENSIFLDGLFSIFYNNNLKVIESYKEAIEQMGCPQLIDFFLGAKTMVEKEYRIKSETSFFGEYPDKDIWNFFSESLINEMEEIESKMTTLLESEEYRYKIERLFEGKW